MRFGAAKGKIGWGASGGQVLLTMMALAAGRTAFSDIETPLASFESSEADLSVAAGAMDTGLTVRRVRGGENGVPTATNGTYLLELNFVNEDHKIEFGLFWSASSYDLLGQESLLADVYVASTSAVAGTVGIWDSHWRPPDEWQAARYAPTCPGLWTTVRMDLANRSQTGLNEIQAIVFDNIAETDGTIYVDNLRFRRTDLFHLATTAFPDRVELVWRVPPIPGVEAYNVYGADADTGPFSRLNPASVTSTGYVDPRCATTTRYYRVAAIVGGQESAMSGILAATYDGLTDEALMDLAQHAAFLYFWEYAHPVSRMARESWGAMGHSGEVVSTGATGMGLMTLVVGASRNFEARAQIAGRVLAILTFLEENTTRYHGAWSHWINGTTGETIPFSSTDDGGDLVETALLAQGLLVVRQYFDSLSDSVEIEIRQRATRLWEGVEWDWYRPPGGSVLYWLWSDQHGFSLPISGYNEAMIAYILAAASPTHPVPPSCYAGGWAGLSSYVNGNSYYGLVQWVGPARGGPLFMTQYSFLGFDPRHKTDPWCGYFRNSRNISLINRAWCIENPGGFAGYHQWVWGLSASSGPDGYGAREPTSGVDNGTITPSAAISAVPFTPSESLATLRHLYDAFGAALWGPYGFRDAFNLQEGWFAPGYLGNNIGTVAPMFENYRSGLCWQKFMADPEIRPVLRQMGWNFSRDFNHDGLVDATDIDTMISCGHGPALDYPTECADVDLDTDGDIDSLDFGWLQTCISSQPNRIDVNCGE